MIDPDKLDFSRFSPSDDYSGKDFTEDDGTDPLGVDQFIRTKASVYDSSDLSRVYTVRYDGEIVGFFAASMSAIEIKRLSPSDVVDGASTKYYPALLLGQMGVDKKHRGKKIGYWICMYSMGLAIEVNPKVACTAVCLETNKVDYYAKCGFSYSGTQKGKAKVWMYRRISQIS